MDRWISILNIPIDEDIVLLKYLVYLLIYNVSHNLSLFCDEEHVTMANPFYFTPQYKNTSFYIHASLTTFKTWLT